MCSPSGTARIALVEDATRAVASSCLALRTQPLAVVEAAHEAHDDRRHQHYQSHDVETNEGRGYSADDEEPRRHQVPPPAPRQVLRTVGVDATVDPLIELPHPCPKPHR